MRNGERAHIGGVVFQVSAIVQSAASSGRYVPSRATTLRKFIGLALAVAAGAAFAWASELGVIQTIPLAKDITIQTCAKWRDFGVDSLLITGVSGLLNKPSQEVPDGLVPASLVSLRSAVECAHAAGLRAAYLRFPLPLLKHDSSDFPPCAEFVRSASQMRQFSSSDGIALDIPTDDPAFHFIGQSYETVRQKQRDNARAFGVALATAAEPGRTLLIVTSDLFRSGTLWFDVLDGIVTTNQAGIILLSRATIGLVHADDMRSIIRNQEALLRVRLSPRGMRAWNEKGQFSAGLQLLDFTNGVAKPVHSADTCRAVLAAAILLGSAQPWMDAEGMRSTSVPEVPDVSYRSKLNHLARVGPFPRDGAPDLFVLRGIESAAIASASGFHKTLQLEHQNKSVTVTNLATEITRTVRPLNGAVTIEPTGQPILIEGLPVRDWITPAGFWLALGEPSADTARSAPLSYGWSNETGVTVRGRLDSNPPRLFTVVPPGIDIDLRSGTRASVDGVIAGPLSPQAGLPVKLVLNSPNTAPVVRTFYLDIPPRMPWAFALQGLAPMFSVVGNLDPTGSASILATSNALDLSCLNADGHAAWTVALSRPLAAAPIVFRHWTGQYRIATIDTAGVLRFMAPDGTPRGEKKLSAPTKKAFMSVANLHAFPGEELVVGQDNGVVTALLSNAQEFWSTKLGAGIQSLQVISESQTRDALLAVTDSENMTKLAADGSIAWQQSMNAQITGEPFVGDWDNDGKKDVVLGLNDGSISIHKLEDGTDLASGSLPDNTNAFALAFSNRSPATELLVSTGGSLLCLAYDFHVRWTAPFHAKSRVRVIQGPPPLILAATDDEGIVALDLDGNNVWKDTRTAAQIDQPVSLLSLNNSPHALYAANDGILRCIRLN